MRLRQESLKNVTLLIKRGIAPKYVKDEGVCIINQKCVRDGRVDFSPSRLTHTNTKIAPEKYLQEGDILVNSTGTGTLGRTAFFLDQKGSRGATVDTHVTIVRADQKKVAPRYLAYLMRLKEPSIVNMARGATNQIELSAVNLGELQVWLHDLLAQYRIASVLSAYDDLIENNRRRIQLLEQAARLLYKEWFVHLRFPGHEHTPIVDGVPEGWEKKTAFEVMDVLSGGTPKTTNPSYWDGDIPFFTPKDATDFAYAHDTEKSITEAGLKNCNSNFYPKDTVFITARGTVGKTNLAQRPMAMNQSCYALVAHPPLNQQFLYFALVDGVEQFRSRAVGAVFDAIVRDTFKLIPFVVPDEKLITAFMEHVFPMLAQIDNLSGQIRILRKARDLLLPKLMNGEVAV
jgi:type I restriction enzyme S subunit